MNELFDEIEACPECGGEMGFGPCACGADGPQRAPKEPVGRGRIASMNGMGGMRGMVERKLARRNALSGRIP